MQSILNLSTRRDSVRDQVVGWTYENGANNLRRAYEERLGTQYEYRSWLEVPVGLVRSGESQDRHVVPHCHYQTVLHAMADGWKLLAPPEKYKEGVHDMYFWWLVKD